MLTDDPTPPPTAAGDALAIVGAASLAGLKADLARLGYRTVGVDDPYAAFAELLDRPLVYRALVISLPALYREELSIVRVVRQRLPHVDVLVAHADGRHAALVEAMKLGATALLSEQTLHRLAEVEPTPGEEPLEAPVDEEGIAADEAGDVPESEEEPEDEPDAFEPLLTAEELRALLQEQPTLPPL